MPEGYEYDNESEGMRDALERAREQAVGTADLDALMEKMRETWTIPEDASAPSSPEPLPNTGDAAATVEEALANVDAKAKRKIEAGMNPPKEPWARMKYDLRENETRQPPPDPIAEKMTEAGWAPRGPNAPGAKPDWAKLKADLTEAEKVDVAKKAPEALAPVEGPDWARMQTDIQDAEHAAETKRTIGAMLHAAAPGFVPPANAGSGDVDAAKTALEVELQRRRADAEAARQKREGESRLLVTAKEQAENDGASPQSKTARDALRPVFEMAGGVPEGFDSWSAKQVKEFAKTLAPIATTKERLGATEAEKEKVAAAKKAADDKKAADESESITQRRAVLALDPRWKKLPGLTAEMISKMNGAALDDLQRQLDATPKDKPKSSHNANVKIEPNKIETVPERRPGYRDLIKGISDGRLQAPQPGTRFGAEVISDVMAFKPDFDATRFGAYRKVADQQAAGKDVMAIDVGLEHLHTARSAIPKNADMPWINKLKQAVATGTGDAEFRPYIAASTVAAHELAKIYNIEDQEGKREVLHQFESVQSPEQLEKVFDTFIELVEGKKKGLKMQRERVAPKSGSAEPQTLKTRKTKAGGTAYLSRKTAELPTAQQRWFTTPEEAEAN